MRREIFHTLAPRILKIFAHSNNQTELSFIFPRPREILKCNFFFLSLHETSIKSIFSVWIIHHHHQLTRDIMITRARAYCYDRTSENWVATIVADAIKEHKSSKWKRDERKTSKKIHDFAFELLCFSANISLILVYLIHRVHSLHSIRMQKFEIRVLYRRTKHTSANCNSVSS